MLTIEFQRVTKRFNLFSALIICYHFSFAEFYRVVGGNLITMEKPTQAVREKSMQPPLRIKSWR